MLKNNELFSLVGNIPLCGGHLAWLFVDGWALGLFLLFRDHVDLFWFLWVCPWDGTVGPGTFQELSGCPPREPSPPYILRQGFGVFLALHQGELPSLQHTGLR